MRTHVYTRTTHSRRALRHALLDQLSQLGLLLSDHLELLLL